jgi:glycosyltransferase involved in cell wall biosynthesis
MRASIIIATHNEGEALSKTIESCIETSAGLDHEIILADDASTDGSVELAERRFTQVRVHRHPERQGVSPTRVLGARNAKGEVLVFVDGHTNPAPGSLARLVADVEETRGRAVLTPQIAALDVQRWSNDTAQRGHGYGFDLLTLECRWLQLKEMRAVRERGRQYYESPAVIGCVMAVGRELYDRLWGFDPHMRFWGCEDLDLGLKCWTMGYRILHDPQVVVGHRFRSQFDNFEVPLEHVVVNQLRLGRKNFTHAVWAEWVDHQREQHAGPLAGHPHGLWAEAWHVFELGRESAEQERAYLMARRQMDEFQYAERFGLNWPRTESKGRAAARLVSPSPSPSPSGGPSPSPPPGCRFQIVGPADVPGLTKYQYQISVPAGKTPTNISWSVDRPTAGFEGATNQATVTVTFKNTAADWIKLRATFVLDGKNECAEKQIALVQVDTGTATFGNPGTVSGSAGGSLVFLENPPPPPAVPTWVTTHDPGSDCAAFTFNGTDQAGEPSQFINSNGGGGGAAFTAETTIKLTSPAQKPTAHQQIQIGFLQGSFHAGSATYATTPPGKKRNIVLPTTNSVDWLVTPCSPGATDDWPWYDQSARVTGSGTSPFSQKLSMIDAPKVGIPTQFNPNNGADPNATKALVSAADTDTFTLRVAARTLDPDLGANKHYFDQGHSNWSVNFVFPVVPGVSIVTTGPDWAKPANPTEVNVNVVPAITLASPKFKQWVPS